MTGAQQTVFQASTGHAPDDVALMIASILVAALSLWAAWLVLRVLASLIKPNPDADQTDLIVTGLRISVLIAIALYVVW